MTILRDANAAYLRMLRHERLSLRAYASLIDTLFESFAGYMALVVAGLVLTAHAYALHHDAANRAMLIAMCAVAATRLVLHMRYRAHLARRRPVIRRSEITVFEAVFAASGALMALTIGVSEAYLTLLDSSAVTFSVSLVVTMGMAGAISGRNGARPKILYLQVLAIVLPFLAAMLLRRTPGMLIVAGLIGVYIVATFVSANAHYRSLRASLRAADRNLRLTRKVERQARMFDTALNNMTSGLLMLDRGGDLVVANDKVKELVGGDLVETMVGRNIKDLFLAVADSFLLSRHEAELVRAEFRHAIEDAREHAITLTDRRLDRILELRTRGIPGQGSVLILDDISEKRRKEAEIHQLARRDVLTDLPNRLSLREHLADAIAACLPSGSVIAMFIDLDHFKEVNDEHGHGVGDALLKEVADRLRASLRRGDFSARIAGDEFVAVFAEVFERDEITLIARRVVAALGAPYRVDGRTLVVSASAGLAAVPGGRGSPDELLRAADVALYAAKDAGRNRALWFDKTMDDRARQRRELTVDFKDALDRGELSLVYQPIVDFWNGKVVCCEALTRWVHPRHGRVPPSVFIGLAEESDLIHRLGMWSLAEACREARRWPETVTVAVNLSPAQFKHASISATIAGVLRHTGLDPHRLEVEITESALAENFERMRDEIETLSRTGVSIVLDDFGTGYSSLSRLHELPIDKLKLDRSFVARLGDGKDVVTLIKSIVQMARTMRKEIVVEGVETAEELATVADAQARMVQGFYFSRPVAGADVAATVHALESGLTRAERLSARA